MPVLPVHLQEAPEVSPQCPSGQEPHQLGPDVRVEGPVLQQGANKVDQLGVQDPGVLALDDILPEVREALLISRVEAGGLQQSAQGVEVRPRVDYVRERDH